MSLAESLLGRVVGWNNRTLERVAPVATNPVDLTQCGWHRRLVERWDQIREEWDAFEDAGSVVPPIEDVIGESQGNAGVWRAGLLSFRGKPCGVAPSFPRTLAVLADVPGLRSALFSVMEPGCELGEHKGPNSGVLRYHLGVVCPDGAALQIGETVIPYREREGVLFDDTAEHAAWNRASTRRITLFLEVLRPARGAAGAANVLVQRVLALDPRYRLAPEKATALHSRLNPG